MTAGLSLATYAILLGALAIGTLLRPPIALAGAICIFGLKQWGQSSVSWLAQHGAFTNIVIGVIVVAALVIRSIRGDCVLCNVSRATWLILSLYSYSLISLVWTPRIDLALPVWQHDYPYMITMALLAPLVVKDRQDLMAALEWTFIIGGSLALLLIFFGNWGLRGLMIDSVMSEGETNPLALAGLAGAVASTAMFFEGRWLWTRNWIIRLAVVAACLLVIVKSGSRGQLVAALLALSVMLPIGFRIGINRGTLAMFAAIAVVGFATEYAIADYAQSHMYDLGSRWSETSAVEDASGRISMIVALLSRWSQSGASILMGLGNSAAFDPNIIGFYPHNMPLEILGEEGMVGFSLYLALLYSIVMSATHAWTIIGNDPQGRKLFAVIGSNFLFFFFLSLKEGNMVGSAYFFMYAALANVFISSVTNTELRAAETPQPGSFNVRPFANLMR